MRGERRSERGSLAIVSFALSPRLFLLVRPRPPSCCYRLRSELSVPAIPRRRTLLRHPLFSLTAAHQFSRQRPGLPPDRLQLSAHAFRASSEVSRAAPDIHTHCERFRSLRRRSPPLSLGPLRLLSLASIEEMSLGRCQIPTLSLFPGRSNPPAASTLDPSPSFPSLPLSSLAPASHARLPGASSILAARPSPTDALTNSQDACHPLRSLNYPSRYPLDVG